MSASDVVEAAAAPSEPVRSPASASRKLMAASIGSMATAITMTPMDVVKVRMQVQAGTPQPLFIPSARPNEATCCRPTFFTENADVLACKFDARSPPPPRLALAGGLAEACEYPTAELARERLGARYLNGFFDAFAKIVRNEGAGALWRGVAPALVMSVPSQATYMVGYDRLRAWALRPDRVPSAFRTRDGQANESYRFLAPLVAGGLSRAAVVSVFSPLELLRTRLQSASGPSDRTGLSAVLRSTGQIVRRDGLASLWRGLPPTLWRDVPFSALYWASYELIRRSLSGGHGLGEGSATGGQTFMVAFASGATAGSIAAIATNPFDVAKTRSQAMRPDPHRPPPSTVTMIRDLYRQEGMAGLASGLKPRLAKVSAACALLVSIYELAAV